MRVYADQLRTHPAMYSSPVPPRSLVNIIVGFPLEITINAPDTESIMPILRSKVELSLKKRMASSVVTTGFTAMIIDALPASTD